MGLLILVGVFVIPFGSSSGTLYGMAGPLLGDLGGVQSSGDAARVTYSYIQVIAFILLVIAGFVGIFPLGTGVLGIVAMAILTLAPSLIYPKGPVTLSIGLGFYVLWAGSVISLGGSFWHKKEEKVTVVVQPAPAAKPS